MAEGVSRAKYESQTVQWNGVSVRLANGEFAGRFARRREGVDGLAWITLLSQDQLEVVVDDVQRYVRLETNSGGAIPTYVTVRFEEPGQIDALIEALSEAKNKLGLF